MLGGALDDEAIKCGPKAVLRALDRKSDRDSILVIVEVTDRRR